MPIIRSSRVLYRWLLPVVFGALVFKLSVWCGAEGYVSGCCSSSPQTDNLKTKAPNTTGSNHLYNTLELLMMGIVVPETCWASNKICNKSHLLHLVGFSFPHINDDARSKSLQISKINLQVYSTQNPSDLSPRNIVDFISAGPTNWLLMQTSSGLIQPARII